MLRHALPKILEGSVVPLAAFALGIRLWGETGAVISGLAVALALFGWRLSRGHRPTIFLLGSIGLLVQRSIVALWTGDLTAYLIQPSIIDLLTAAFFVGSVLLRRPFVGRLAADLFPIPDDVRARPRFRRTFARLTIAWAGVALANGAVQLWAVLFGTIDVYLAAKAFLLLGTVVPAVLVTVVAGRRLVVDLHHIARQDTAADAAAAPVGA